MKHLVTLLLAGATALTTANAQAFVGNKFLDNWSIGINGGAVTPSTRDYWKHVRAVSGLELTKGLNPLRFSGHLLQRWMEHHRQLHRR